MVTFRLVFLAFALLHSQILRAERLPILLAEVATSDIDPARYLVSEKLDGVRAFWNGKQLYFRSGNPINTPRWFIDKLPKRPLDGELWLGRGRFDELSGELRATVPTPGFWRNVRYMIFELPPQSCCAQAACPPRVSIEAACDADFSTRYQAMQRLLAAAKFPQLQVLEQRHFVSNKQLRDWFDQQLAGGAEGAMLHLASAPYQSGRSDVLLKLKPLHDTEAIVLGYVPGKGRLAGLMGSLRVQTEASSWFAQGIEFRLGTGFSDAQRQTPPAIGSRVTFRFRGKTSTGKPRFASFLRVREDH